MVDEVDIDEVVVDVVDDVLTADDEAETDDADFVPDAVLDADEAKATGARGARARRRGSMEGMLEGS